MTEIYNTEACLHRKRKGQNFIFVVADRFRFSKRLEFWNFGNVKALC